MTDYIHKTGGKTMSEEIASQVPYLTAQICVTMISNGALKHTDNQSVADKRNSLLQSSNFHISTSNDSSDEIMRVKILSMNKYGTVNMNVCHTKKPGLVVQSLNYGIRCSRADNCKLQKNRSLLERSNEIDTPIPRRLLSW